jgi:signal transduction histidine kinase
MNLLGNAVTYNQPGGSVVLSAELDDTTFQLKITDNGRGISAAHLPHIFQPFYRAPGTRLDDSDGDQPQHLGLGLYLVDAHVKSLGGECHIDSTVGAGTTVTIVLPDIAVPEAATLVGAAI